MKLNKNVIIILLMMIVITSTGYQFSRANNQETENETWEEDIDWENFDDEDIQWFDEDGNEIDPSEFEDFPEYSFADEKDFLLEWINDTVTFLNEVQEENGENLSKEINQAKSIKEKINASQSEAELDQLESEMDQLEASLDIIFPPLTAEEEKAFAQEWINDLKLFLTEEDLSEFNVDSTSLLNKINSAESKLEQYRSEDDYEVIDGVYTTLDEVETDLDVVFEDYEEISLEEAKDELIDWVEYIKEFINEAAQEGIQINSYQSELQRIEQQTKEANNWDQMDQLFIQLENLDEKLEQAY